MKKIKNLITDNGVLYIEVPFRDDIQNNVIEGHIFFFGKQSINSILDGYRIVNSKYFWSGVTLRGKFDIPPLGSKLFKADSLIVDKGDNFRQTGLFAWQRTIRSDNVGELYIGLTTNSLGVICSLTT